MRNPTLLLAFFTAGWLEAGSVPAGTHFLLRLEHNVSSESAKPGDFIHLRTVSPISDGSSVVIPANSQILAVLTKVKRGGRLRRNADLEMELAQLMLPDGRTVPISSPPIAAAAPLRRTASTGRVGPGSILGSSLVGLMLVRGSGSTRASVGVGVGVMAAGTLVVRGKDVELQTGAMLDASFDQPVPIP